MWWTCNWDITLNIIIIIHQVLPTNHFFNSIKMIVNTHFPWCVLFCLMVVSLHVLDHWLMKWYYQCQVLMVTGQHWSTLEYLRHMSHVSTSLHTAMHQTLPGQCTQCTNSTILHQFIKYFSYNIYKSKSHIFLGRKTFRWLKKYFFFDVQSMFCAQLREICFSCLLWHLPITLTLTIINQSKYFPVFFRIF